MTAKHREESCFQTQIQSFENMRGTHCVIGKVT